MNEIILVPIDFSKNALIAAQYAIGFAEQEGYTLHFIHAYRPFKSAFQTQADNEEEQKEARQLAEKKMSRFERSLGSVEPVIASFSVVEGDLVKSLNRYIDEHPVELVIMGTHGESGPNKDILGSNTNDVAYGINVPLIIVPEHYSGFQLNNIVFFTDYQQNDVQTLRTFQNLLVEVIPCSLVHIGDNGPPNDKEHQKLEEWKIKLEQETGYNILKTELVDEEEKMDLISRIIDSLGADLTLLTLVEGRGFFEKLFHKSLARAIVLNPKTPVLVNATGE